MSSETYVIIVGVILSGLLSGSIAAERQPGPGVFFGYLVLGLLFPIIGLIAAFLVKRPVPPPQPPGWYPDPWQFGQVRYYDGREWTYHQQAPV